jgi:hypothetical protein
LVVEFASSRKRRTEQKKEKRIVHGVSLAERMLVAVT